MESTPRHHKIISASSYDRGLDMLLKVWDDIKKVVPDATLDVYYGWNLFDKGYANNPERMMWKERVNKQMEKQGITHHGRVGQQELKEARQEAGVWAYPTYFDEINCITALEMQNDGVVPCVINKGALDETVQSGVKVDGDIYDPDVREEYKNQLIALMRDEDRWKTEQEKGIKFAKDYNWSIIANEWTKNF